VGTITRCLCPILTLLIVGLRPSAGIRNGSIESDPWWGTKDAEQFRKAIDRARRSGDFDSLQSLCRKAAEQALKHHGYAARARLLLTAGAADMARYRYRAALDALLNARLSADLVSDRLDEAAAEANLSSLFLEMSDLDSAQRYAELAYKRSRGLPDPYFEHQLRLQLGRVYALQGNPRAEAMFREGIDAARAAADVAQEARGWDLLGDWRIDKGREADAEAAFTESFRIRRLGYSADLPFSYARIGALRLKQQRIEEAGRFTALAIGSGNRIQASFPRFLLIHQRGRILLARGDTRAALADFETAVKLAAAWRRETLPSIATLTGTNVELQKRVYDSLVDAAARIAVERHDSDAAWKAFQALEDNRAISLRQVLDIGERWKHGVPVSYWDEYGQIRADRIHSEPNISKLEAEIGLPVNIKENFRTQNSLIHFQRVLSGSQLLVSFRLGGQDAYAWGITRTSFAVHKLGSSEAIRRNLERFRDAVERGSPEAAPAGEQVYGQLFGWLSAEETRKSGWVISGEDALLEAPLAALVTERKGDRLTYLVEQHSLQLVPGAMSLSGVQMANENGEWLGVGDAIYNRADPRWQKAGRSIAGSAWFASAALPELNRLAGSAEELRTSAQAWRGSSILLEGSEATRGNFEAAISRRPAVVHLATHVVNGGIVFGMNPGGAPDILPAGDIARLRVPGAVVTMTGCASGTGEIRSGAGLLGLVRAWQMAGTAAVIGTLWPVVDSSSGLFPIFYIHLHEAPPAEAMRRTQADMIRAGGWRASPANWAAYLVNSVEVNGVTQ
jgi:CHAT domain-containing protein/tetratricopeptide (TPR) repeat protein